MVIAMVLFTVFKQFDGGRMASANQMAYSDFLEEVRSNRVKQATIPDGLGGGDIIAVMTDDRRVRVNASALDRGLIDAAEFNNASSDRVLGFADVAQNCMLQSFHQSAEQFEILFNGPKYRALPQELRSIVDYAVQAASADISWKAIDRNSKDYIELKKAGVKFYKTPDAILRAQLASWDKTVAKQSAENPLFKKVLDSQRQFAERAGQWQNDYSVDLKMAYDHYFSGKKS